ncbi:uncharacterized protein [Ptychodera flava]|uniref:uncharacterized protein n=1 Tax=Ptychodera flava TaxID=63121 RepID=UPI00396A1F5F
MATSGGDDIYVESPGEAQGIEEGNSGQSQGETQVRGDTESGATDCGFVVDSVLEKIVRAMKNVERSSIKRFATRLSLSDDNLADVGCDDEDIPLIDVKRALCEKWLETHGANASIQWFVNALKHIGLYVDAHNLQYENIDVREQGNGTSVVAMATSPPFRTGTFDGSTINRAGASRGNQTGCPVSLRQPCDLFTGKTHIECCSNIEKLYNTRRGQGSESHRVLVEILIGLGGCGKSEILCQYVWNNWSKYKGGVFILNGQSSNYIDFGLKRLLNVSEKYENPNTLFHNKGYSSDKGCSM